MSGLSLWTPPPQPIIVPGRELVIPWYRVPQRDVQREIQQAAWSVLVGTVINTTTTLSPVANASHATNDIDIIPLEHSGEGVPALTTAAGYAQVTGAHIVVDGPGPAANTAALTLFWRRWNGTDGNPTFTDIGNHMHGGVISVRGAITTGNPWDQVVTSSATPGGTSISITGGTATVADTFVLACCGTNLPDAATTTEYSAPADSTLTSVTERIDDTTTAGNGGGLLAITGQLATAVAWGPTTATAVTSARHAKIAINLKPDAGAAAQVPYRSVYRQLLAH